MFALALALLAPTADPLPKPKALDSVTYAIGNEFFRPTGALTVTADGKVSYHNQPGLYTTASGGKRHDASWEIKKEEAAALLAGLVEDGLLELPLRVTHVADVRFTAVSGKWRMYLHADPIPEKLAARFQPLLEKADPTVWKKAAREVAPHAVTSFQFHFTDDAFNEATFSISRDGSVGYFRRRQKGHPQGAGSVTGGLTSIPKADAEKLLDALATDGALDIPDAVKQAPRFHVQVFSGRWVIEARPHALPDAVMKHIRPLFPKDDAGFWKPSK